MGEQFVLWGVLMQIANSILEPILTPIAQEIWKAHPDRVLPAADLADMVVRNVLDMASARDAAAESGVAPDNFERLVRNTGEPLPLQMAMEAWRRGLLPESAGEGSAIGPGGLSEQVELPSLDQAIRESRLKDKYIPIAKGLQFQPLSAAEAVAAWLRGQISEADALARARVAGTTEADARVLYNSAGRSPAPGELATLLHRGLIPLEGVGPEQLSFQQGIYEGDSKDKWWRLLAALAQHLPPPRTIVAMVRSGAMSDETARDYLEKNGLSPELAAAYLADAHHSKTQSQRDLTTAQVLEARAQKLIDEPTAVRLLVQLRWTPENASLLLRERELRTARAQLDNAVTRTRSLFIAHKISRAEVEKALAAFQLPLEAIAQYLQTWTLERRANVKLLTETEIAHAFANGWLAEADALTEYAQMGYSPRDAWIALAYHSKTKLSGAMPAETVSGDELSPGR